MYKIPARHAWFVMPAILALMMTFIVSGISTAKAIGIVPSFSVEWMQAWFVSYLVAFPTLLLLLPVVRRIVGLIVEAPAKP